MKLLGFSYHFRGKTRALLAVSQCFQEHPGKGLHPTEISRYTGYNFVDINDLLRGTPELFVKLPSRGGSSVVRYRLATSVSGKSPEELEEFIQQSARKETLTLYAVVGIVVSIFAMAIIMSFPLSSWL